MEYKEPNLPTLVAVYGTLLSGQGNHRVLGDSRLVTPAESVFWGTMYSAGGFPILSFHEATSKVKVELYEVTDPRIMQGLDNLEGYPGWYDRTRKTFLTEEGETMTAWIYHQDEEREQLHVIEDGDWKNFTGNRKGRA